MNNAKYYIILLIGIFLSLGLGMLIGITLGSYDIVENQQELITEQIEKEISKLKGETERLKSEKNVLREEKEQADMLSNLLLANFANNRLNGLRVSLIRMGKNYDYSELATFLNISGVHLETDVTICGSIYTTDVGALIEPLEVSGVDLYSKRSKIFETIAEDLLESVSDQLFSPFLMHLKEMGIISGVWGSEYVGNDVIIIAGNGLPYEINNEQSYILFDSVVLKEALEAGMRIVAVEMLEVENSAIAEYEKLGIETIPEVDTVYGRLALVSLLEDSIVRDEEWSQMR
jgi:hypothetical protein